MVIILIAHVYFVFHESRKWPQALFHIHKLLLDFLNLQTLQYMKMKLGTHVFFSISIMTNHQQKWLSSTTSSLYSTCKQCMKVKLGTHVHFSISMTTVNKNWPEALFCITIFTTTSLLKLVTRITHEGETW